MVYMVLGNFEKKLALCEAERGLEMSFGTPYQKSADTLKFVFTQVTYISQQKKVNTISDVGKTDRLIAGVKLLNCLRSIGTIVHSNRNWLKKPQSHIHQAISHKSVYFLLFWCILCWVTPNISSSSKNINKYDLCFQTIFLFLMTMMPGI